MIYNKIEYDKMAETEATHWWYNALHSQILQQIKNHFKENKIIKIVDIGCGTGGLLQKLQQNNFTNISGFDISDFAVEYCQQKNLNVFQATMIDIENHYTKDSIDVLISADNLYFIEETKRNALIKKYYNLLRNNGLLIMNLPSLQAFSGIHDESVGIKKRHHHNELQILFKDNFTDYKYYYWPQTLAPIIFLQRFFQRKKMKQGNYKIESDVDVPSKFVNKTLGFLMKIEQKLQLPFSFASSLFVVAMK